MPVIPATQEAEKGESLNPGGRGCSELRSHHCTPAWATRAKLCLTKKRTRSTFDNAAPSSTKVVSFMIDQNNQENEGKSLEVGVRREKNIKQIKSCPVVPGPGLAILVQVIPTRVS